MLYRIASLLAIALALASCGGGDVAPASANDATPAARAAAALQAAPIAAADTAARRRALAGQEAAPIDPLDAANQLMDFAEVYHAEYFPGHPATGTALGYFYRYYESTGIYLGVREGQVYVLGGGFGSEVVPVGPLTQFITPRPLVLSTLCAATGASHDTFATPIPVVGKNAAVAVAACSGSIGSPQWRQTAGPTVALVSLRNQTLSFEPPEPGAYAFQVSFTDAQGTPRTAEVALTAAAAPDDAASAPQLVVRASQSVRMGGKVSVRAWPTLPEGDSVKAVTWTQIEGPAVTLDTSTSRLALFTAPGVTRDTVIRLRATLHTALGRAASDEVAVLVERSVQPDENDADAMWAGQHVPRVYAYRADGPYSAVLQSCTFDPGMTMSGPRMNLCTLGRLPFLAQDSGGGLPSVEQVMDRVLVSHDWLGRNFEAFLRTQDTRGDFRRMLNSVTAIVLSTQVRPSFYYGGTGAIYLDGDTFWLTPEERDTMNEAPDYRSDFGNELQFINLWRYVKDGQSLFTYYDTRSRITRTMDDVRNETGWVMYHELGHALDFVPPSVYPVLDRSRTAWGNIATRYMYYMLTSDRIDVDYPLTSTQMHGLGQVLYAGTTASSVQRGYSATQVGGFFAPDLATDPYSYTDPREDTAMTLEEVLMQRRQGIRRDVAFIDALDPEADWTTAAIVRWGQRGRVGDPKLAPRARAIVAALAPWVGSAEVDQLPAPIAMRVGETWEANLAEAAIPRLAQPQGVRPTLQQLWQFRKELEHMRARQHAGARRLPPAEIDTGRRR